MSEAPTVASRLANEGTFSEAIETLASIVDGQSPSPPRVMMVPPDGILHGGTMNLNAAMRDTDSSSSVFSSPRSCLSLKAEGDGLVMDISSPWQRGRGVNTTNVEKQAAKKTKEQQECHCENLPGLYKIISPRDVNVSLGLTQGVQEETLLFQPRLSDDIPSVPVVPLQSPLPSNAVPSTSSAAASSIVPPPSPLFSSGGIELPSSPAVWDLLCSPSSRISRTRGIAPLRSAEKHEEMEFNTKVFTVLDYAMQREKPRIRARSLQLQVFAFLTTVVVLPFLLVVLLLGTHYWFIRKLITVVEVSPTMVHVKEGGYGTYFSELTQDNIGPMTREAFMFIIGVGLAFVFLVLGGICFFWAVHWRHVFSPYLKLLAFICAAAPVLSKIEALTPEQLRKAPKPEKGPLFWRKDNNESLITQITDKVVLLGNLLQELKQYVPHPERSSLFHVITKLQNRIDTVSTHASDRYSGSLLRRSRHRREPPLETASSHDGVVSYTFSPTDPGVIDNNNDNKSGDSNVLHAPRKELLTLSSTGTLLEEVNPVAEARTIMAKDAEKANTPRQRGVAFAAGYTPPDFSPSVNDSMTRMCERGRLIRMLKGKEQRAPGGEVKNMAVGDFGYSIHQVTFLVCRLFLPKIDVNSDSKVINETVAEIQKMSVWFLNVVLQLAREENGAPVDIRLDSVTITFHAPSGPNSVNLVDPSSCAFRVVSRLGLLELQWSKVSSTPFVWGVTMHLGKFVVGVCTTGTRNIRVLYSEEVKLAHRVTELCYILNTPLLMFQSCYNVFRVCMTAVPVDIIWKDTCNGGCYSYLYSPKVFGDEEEVNSERARYVPIVEAFGLMCEKHFTEAYKKLEGLLDLDNSVGQLQRLCIYFARLQKKGKLNALFPDGARYSRDELKWNSVELNAKEFLQNHAMGRRSDDEEVLHRCETYPFIEKSEESLVKSEATDERRSSVAFTPICSAAADTPPVPQTDPLTVSVFSITVPPSLATHLGYHMHDSKCPSSLFTGAPRLCSEHMDSQGTNIQQCVRASHVVTLNSAMLIENEAGFRHGAHVKDDAIGCRDGEGEKEEGVGSVDGSGLCVDLFEPIGQGTFGTIYRGMLRDGTFVAVKKLNIPDKEREKPWIQTLRYEVEILTGFSHENILRCIGSGFMCGSFCIVTELVPGGSLATLVKAFYSLPHDTIRIYTGDILRGIRCLHERLIVHRDISPNNVLVNIDGVCKLGDFGGAVECAMQSTARGGDLPSHGTDPSNTEAKTMMHSDADMGLSSTRTVLHKDWFGTPACMSPEACSGIVDPKNDIWSLGITLYFCFSGRYPWPDAEMNDPFSFVEKIRDGCLTPNIACDRIDPQAVDFIKLCLTRNASERPTATELMFHAFLVN